MKLTCGVGINDADYRISILETIGYIDGKQKQKLIWRCPFYRAWKNMLTRCYSLKYQRKNPAYLGCTVVLEWHRFSVFKQWMELQEWQGNQLDKDLLIQGNKVYGPNYCVFVSRQVNSFMVDRKLHRGEWPLGVHQHTQNGNFVAHCRNPFEERTEHLGSFETPHQAHLAWVSRKLELAIQLADLQNNPTIAEALIRRYSSNEQGKTL